MVSVSRESVRETERRLRQVIAQAEFEVLPGIWSFVETPAVGPPEFDSNTLAIVRDGHSWCALQPHTGGDDSDETFGVFSFHFPSGVDNSGFVGWLATHLKRDLGTGVFVICGSNRERGGIYDYWGCPSQLLGEAVGVIRGLVGAGSR